MCLHRMTSALVLTQSRFACFIKIETITSSFLFTTLEKKIFEFHYRLVDQNTVCWRNLRDEHRRAPFLCVCFQLLFVQATLHAYIIHKSILPTFNAIFKSVGYCRGSRVKCRGSMVNCRRSRVNCRGKKRWQAYRTPTFVTYNMYVCRCLILGLPNYFASNLFLLWAICALVLNLCLALTLRDVLKPHDSNVPYLLD